MELRGKRWDNERALAKIGDKRLRSLDLFDTSVDDEFLEIVGGRGALTSVHIAGETITDRGLAFLAEKNRITSFLLSGVPHATDRCLESVAQCKTIRELYLDGTSITDDGLQCVSDLPDIWSLNVSNTSITDEGIGRIASNTIQLISFDNCAIEGTGFSTWSQSDKMSFYGHGSGLTDDGFATACASLSRMWNVIISNTLIGNDGVRALAGQSPTMLRINKSKIDRAGIEWIVANIPVEGLDVDPTQLSKAEAQSLPKPRRLRISVYELG